MPPSRPSKKTIIAILVKRTTLFFFLLCILAVYLYVIGTAQEFMDGTQLLLLRASVILGLSLGMASIYGIALNIWLIFHHKKYRFLGSTGLYIALALFGLAAATAAAFIIVLSGGNRV
ncbi:hypothetical protein TREPR_2419 [Treponema primitia ZAS-2]|uniref:Uncharacterized protein n=1 Tax=Treponema primitia (strain ATCC BAA-887 / DSM 12427 / ZAS-2) TaxID=545694 RepID=F5YHG2_TREPZ|nr:hypothetical protein [Treponema primitia]AEF83551.1 hypothetical protein TREPR_2419 [Treponema primitia ZAS-2]